MSKFWPENAISKIIYLINNKWRNTCKGKAMIEVNVINVRIIKIIFSIKYNIRRIIIIKVRIIIKNNLSSDFNM